MSIGNLIGALPGGIAQGIIWGIMALGVYITFRLLDVADLTVDGTFTTGGATCVMLILAGWNPWLAMLVAFLAGMAAGAVTGLLHTKLGIPTILAGILTQFSLYSINLAIMGMAANKAVSADKYALVVTSRVIPPTIAIGAVIAAVLIAIMYWYFGTEAGSAMRATGCNPTMAKAQGINIDRMTVLGLAFSNGIVAFSGALMAQLQGFSDINM
ncbi:MAG: ABC transporter permease, partial [Erysipelotrichaceae bacterium]|nr:ABC transporter permease [Erysipelotrichaceae bacterium]